MDRLQLSSDVNELFSSGGINEDLLRKIDSGNNRVVYLIESDRYQIESGKFVVKVELNGSENRNEWKAWEKYQNTSTGSFLVPVKYRSDDFTWIIMPFYQSISSKDVNDSIYDKLSDMGSDISRNDFVLGDDGQLCCDYPSIL